MAKTTGRNTNIHGNVSKLTQIGTVNGNVLIVSEQAIKEASPSPYENMVDISDYIKVVVASNRFGRKLQFRIPQDMTAGAFIDLATDVLKLPLSKSIDELMLTFDFRYSVIFNNKELHRGQTLRSAGVSDGDEVRLSINSLLTDEIEKAEEMEAKEVGTVLYDMMSVLREKRKREIARNARGVLTQSKIEYLAKSCFAFVNDIGK